MSAPCHRVSSSHCAARAKLGLMGRGWVRFGIAMAALGLVFAGCGSDAPASQATANSAPDAAVSPQDAGLPLGAAKLSAEQEAAATAFATAWAAQQVAAHPQLAGISAPRIVPVYEEHSDGPVGARAVFTLPAVIPEVEMELVRLHRSGPETMPSRIDNLRTLEMIYLFDGQQVVHVGIVADPSDATNPAGEAVVHPINPEQYRSADFGGNE